MINNSNEWGMRGKDADPETTFSNILSILESTGFDTDYLEIPQTVDTCFASHVTLKGPLGKFISSNGKGLSRSLCKASAYAELMERLQNILFTTMPSLSDPIFHDILELSDQLYDFHDSKQPDCITALKNRLVATADKSVPLFVSNMLVNDLLTDFSPDSDPCKFYARKFYSLSQKKYVDLPMDIILNFALSNGMASGNTLEEAIVQGCSEIFERYAENFLLKGETVPPSIPREVIDSIPSVKHIIDHIESIGRYNVIIKDCSLGKGLPVVCGIICDTHNQTFGVKFGSYPDIAVALERVFSESLQGYTLETFSSGGSPLFGQSFSRSNNWNLIKTGSGSFPASLLQKEADYDYVPWNDIHKESNKERMHDMLELLKTLSDDIYISDCSFLGFPAVMIYAAGASEVRPVDLPMLKEIKLRNDVSRYFHTEEPFTKEQLKKIHKLCLVKRNAHFENTFSNLTGMILSEDVPGAPDESGFLQAMCSYGLGDLDGAISEIYSVIRYKKGTSDPDKSYINTVFLYLNALKSGYNMEKAKEILLQLAPADIVDKVFYDLSDPEKVIERIYPVCPSYKCSACNVKGCLNKELSDFYYKLYKLKAENPVDPSKLETLLTNE